MPPVRLVRFFGGIVVSAALALAATPGGDAAATTTGTPTNAAKVQRWGNAQFKDEFIGPLSSRWAVDHPGLVRNQNGMLTLDSATTSDTVVATLQGASRQYGRWEARVRGRQYGAGGPAYRVVWELAPTGDDHCGARGIVLGDYALGTGTARMHVRTLPDADFTAAKSLPLRSNEFHTYAVEVTPDHVSWFVDTRVVMTERRPAARSGATYSVRFRLVARPGVRMTRGRMQMDWVRYYTLARPNAQPITAPQSTLGTYTGAC